MNAKLTSDHNGKIMDGTGQVIGFMTSNVDAGRLVACANACAGMTTEAVQSIPVPLDQLARDYRNMQRERDASAEEVTKWRNEALRIGGLNAKNIGEAKAVRDELLEALKPFSRLLQEHHERLPDSQPIYGIGDTLIHVGDMRRAVAAITKVKGEGQ